MSRASESSVAWSREEIEAAPRVIYGETRHVRFQDVDAAGTIYFPRVLEYFGDAYLGLLTAAGLDVPKMLRERTGAAPLRHAEADFLRPLFFGDHVTVEIVRARLGESSATFGHRITKDGQLMSIGTTVHVFVDGHTFQKTALPEALRTHVTERG